MGLFERFPYTNLHNLNLDWILRKMKELEDYVKNLSSNISEEINEEVNNKVEELVNSGELEKLVNEELFNQINGYINDIQQSLYNNGIFSPLNFVECGVGKQFTDLVSTVHNCNPSIPTVIFLYPGLYKTELAQTDNSHYGLTLDNIFIIGVGNRKEIQIESGEITEPASTICLKNNSGLYNLFISGSSGRYTVHDDFHNLKNTKPQFRRIIDCELYANDGVAAQVYGAGVKSSQSLFIKNSYFYGFKNDAFRIHNMTGVDDESNIEIENSFFVSNGQYKYHMILACLDNFNGERNTKPVNVSITGGNIDSIIFTNENSGNNSNVWRIYCDHELEYKDLTNAYKPWEQFIRGMSYYAVTKEASPAAGDIVILATGGAQVQKLSPGTGNSKYAQAAHGYCLRNPYLGICFVVRKGVLPIKEIKPAFAVFDTVTIADNGKLEANGTGRKVGYVDALSNVHLNFE